MDFTDWSCPAFLLIKRSTCLRLPYIDEVGLFGFWWWLFCKFWLKLWFIGLLLTWLILINWSIIFLLFAPAPWTIIPLWQLIFKLADEIFSFTEGQINEAGDTLKVEVCVSDCPYVQNEPYLIDLIAADDACPLPQRDTVRVTIIVEPPTNQDPFFVNESDTNYVNIKWNSQYSTEIIGADNDLDSLSMDYFIIPDKPEYDSEDYGITFNSLESGAGSISSFLNIDTYCRQYDYSDRSNFLLGIVLDDLDTCDIFNQDTIFYDISVELPDNSGPKLTTDKEITDSVNTRPNFSIVELETNLSGAFSMNLFSDDFDNDTLVMSAEGVGFNLEN